MSAAFTPSASDTASEGLLSTAASPVFPLRPPCLFLCGGAAAGVPEAFFDSAAVCLESSAVAAEEVEDEGMNEVEVSEETLIEDDEE